MLRDYLMGFPLYLENRSTDNVSITSLGSISHCTIILIEGILPPYQTWIFHATVNCISFTISTELGIEYFLCALVSTDS